MPKYGNRGKKKHTVGTVAFELTAENRRHTYLIQAVFLLAARDIFGLGHDRLIRFYARAKMYFNSVNSGAITLNDLLETLQDEVGIAVGPSGLKSLKGQHPPVAEAGLYKFDKDDTTDDSAGHDPTEVKVQSKQLSDKIAAHDIKVHTRL